MGFADSDLHEGSHPTVGIGQMDPISRFVTTLLNVNGYLQERGRHDKALGYINSCHSPCTHCQTRNFQVSGTWLKRMS